jgi:hypothetical protein
VVPAPEPFELPTDRLRRLPALQPGEVHIAEALGRCVVCPTHGLHPAKVHAVPNRDGWVEVECQIGRTLVPVGKPVVVIEQEVAEDEWSATPKHNRVLAARLARQPH